MLHGTCLMGALGPNIWRVGTQIRGCVKPRMPLYFAENREYDSEDFNNRQNLFEENGLASRQLCQSKQGEMSVQAKMVEHSHKPTGNVESKFRRSHGGNR